MEKTIYNLELHETLQIRDESLQIQRVPGGWNYIYTRQDFNEEDDYYETVISHIVFVPYDNEFYKSAEIKPEL